MLRKSKTKNKIDVEAIVGVNGIKCDVRFKIFISIAEDIDQYGEVENEAGTKKFQIKVVGHSKELLRVKIKGVDDRDVAFSLKGTGFYVSKDKLPNLEEEEFYHTDLIGLDVKSSEDEAFIGEVAGVYNFGAGDMLEVKTSMSGKSEMIPFTKVYVPTINIKDGYIIIASFLNFAEDDGDVEDEG